jgi:hypothetical protein
VGKNTSPNPLENPEATEFTVQVDDFKIVYVGGSNDDLGLNDLPLGQLHITGQFADLDPQPG